MPPADQNWATRSIWNRHGDKTQFACAGKIGRIDLGIEAITANWFWNSLSDWSKVRCCILGHLCHRVMWATVVLIFIHGTYFVHPPAISNARCSTDTKHGDASLREEQT